MKAQTPFRLAIAAALLSLCAVVPSFAQGHGPASPQDRAQQERPVQRPNGRPPSNGPGARPTGQNQHLAQWMENHRNLSLQDQQRALENEPGFHELPPQVQQRYRGELLQLYNMNPQQRQRMLDRNEALERMSPPQRQQWRQAVVQLNGLPIPRRRMMARAILDLREMPPGQREQVINSPAFRAQFSDEERTTLSTLLTAEPYPPTPAP